MGISGTFDPLDTPSSVSTVHHPTKFLIGSIYSRYKSRPCDSDNQERPTFQRFQSFLVLNGNAYPSFLPLSIVIGISKLLNKTLTQTPLLVIEIYLRKIAAFWLFRLLSLSYLGYYLLLFILGYYH